MKKEYKPTPPENQVNEPVAVYQPVSNQPLAEMFPGIVISTMEKQENEMRQYSASLSPVERMEYLQELIKRAYGHILADSNANLWEKIIYIDKK